MRQTLIDDFALIPTIIEKIKSSYKIAKKGNYAK